MNKLIQDSWDILKKNTNLYTAVILIMILSDLVAPAPSASVFYIIGITAFGCISMAINAGLTNQIKVVLAKEERSKFDDLLAGIGKYFNVILLGNIVLTTAFGLIFLALYYLAYNLIGMTDQDLEGFKKVVNEIQKLKPTDIQAYIKTIDPRLVRIASEWTLTFLIYAGFYTLVYFFIGLWTQMCVLKGTGWLESWKKSYRIVNKNFWLYTGLTFFQSIFYITFLSVNILFRDPFTQILFTIMNIITDTYFSVLYCLFIYRFDEDKKIELITDELQPPVSKI